MGLDILGESGPGEGEVVSHKVINRVSRNQSYSVPSASSNRHCALHELTQSVGQPKNGIGREEQSALAWVVNGAGDVVITLADLCIQVGFSIGLGVGSSTPWGPGANFNLLPSLKGDIS